MWRHQIGKALIVGVALLGAAVCFSGSANSQQPSAAANAGAQADSLRARLVGQWAATEGAQTLSFTETTVDVNGAGAVAYQLEGNTLSFTLPTGEQRGGAVSFADTHLVIVLANGETRTFSRR